MKIKIKLIAKQGHAALIEWTGDDLLLHRSVVPPETIDGNEIDPAQLDYAIHQDGPDLVKALGFDLVIPVDVLQNELRKVGIWTKEDYLANGNAKVIQGVLQRLYGVDVATLQNIAATGE